MTPATCLPNNCFCELVRPIGVAQPSDTWSNAAFIVLGFLIILLALSDRKKSVDFKNFVPYGLFYGLLMILLGLGSMYYHAKLNFLGQFLDNLGMFLIISAIFFYRIKIFNEFSPRQVARHQPQTPSVSSRASASETRDPEPCSNWIPDIFHSPEKFRDDTRSNPEKKIQKTMSIRLHSWFIFFSFALTNIFLGIIQYFYPETRRYLFALAVIIVLITEYLIYKRRQVFYNKKFLFFAIGLLALGFAIWIADITKVLCLPNSLLQGHALWHILTALSAMFVFLFYRSELKYNE